MGVSSSDFVTGQSVQLPDRAADIQISTTGGEVTEQTLIQIRRGPAITELPPVDEDVEQSSAREEEEVTETEVSRDGRPVIPSSGYEDPLCYEDPVMQISGAGHWFLEGWIGDHSVEFLVDSGSSVTAMSDSFYQNLVCAGAPLGALQATARTLRSANGTGIEVMGCSRCSVSFLGLQTEFSIIICSLATGTDAIIGTDVLGSVLPHTLDIKNGVAVSLQLHRKDSTLSGRDFTVGHSSIPPYSEAVLHCYVRTTGGRSLPSSGLLEGLTLFAEDTGLFVGRTLVDPSGWKVPVLVSNFRPGDGCSESVHRSRNDHSSDRHTVCGGQRNATSGGGRRTTLSSPGFGGSDVRRLGWRPETPVGGSFVGVCGYISCPGRSTHRPHGGGGT